MAKVDGHVREPLYRQLETELRQQIASGQLKAGERLESEPELASRHGMARMTARRAIETLVREGLLVRHRGRGTFVSEPRMAYPPASLISFSRTMAALGLPVSTRLLEMELVAAHGDVATALEFDEGTPVLLVRRLRFVKDEPVAIHASYMARGYLDGLRAADLMTLPISEAMENVTGVHIVASRDYLEATAATHEEAALLQIAPGDPVQLVIGVAYDSAGRPALATRATYRADRFRFAIGARAGDLPFEITGGRKPGPAE
jgi:GntR family transcriptional regulator